MNGLYVEAAIVDKDKINNTRNHISIMYIVNLDFLVFDKMFLNTGVAINIPIVKASISTLST